MRIVIGHDDDIGVLSGNRTHDGALEVVSFAGRAEHNHDLAVTGAVHSLQRAGQAVGVMREVHDGVRRQRNQLHAAGHHRGERRTGGQGRQQQLALGGIGIEVRHEGGQGRVRNVKICGQARVALNAFAGAVLQVEAVAQTLALHADHGPIALAKLGGDLGEAGTAGGHQTVYMLGAHPLGGGGVHLLAPAVVRGNYGQLGALGGEQLRLRLKVVLHRAVQVQVVLRQVRKTGHGILHAVDTVVVNRVGGHLHRRAPQAVLTHDGQQRMHVGRLGGGHLRGHGHAVNQNLNRANQAGLYTQTGAENGLQHVGGGGLAIRAGHRVTVSSGEGCRTVNLRGQRAHVLAQVLGHQQRNRGLTQQLGTGGIGQNRRGSQLQGALGELRAVHLRTGQGHVQVSRADTARVHADAGHLNVLNSAALLRGRTRAHLGTEITQGVEKVPQAHGAHRFRAQSLGIAAQQIRAGCVRCGIHHPSFLSADWAGSSLLWCLGAHGVIQYSTVLISWRVFRILIHPREETVSTRYSYRPRRSESTPVHR